jgi:hypothetical protein
MFAKGGRGHEAGDLRGHGTPGTTAGRRHAHQGGEGGVGRPSARTCEGVV